MPGTAVDLRYCSDLRIISLESNRLTTPVLDLRPLSQLRSLQLYGNPLEFLMELSPCTALRHLSLANVRMSADPTFMKCEVEVVATSYMGRTNKLAALFAIIFRRSACQHPLLAGALGEPSAFHVSYRCLFLVLTWLHEPMRRILAVVGGGHSCDLGLRPPPPGSGTR